MTASPAVESTTRGAAVGRPDRTRPGGEVTSVASSWVVVAGGLASLIGTIQYVVVQLVVANGWDPPYSWRNNRIVDLGSTRCGRVVVDDSRYVCSPWHALMNVSFATGGVLTIVGAALLSRTWTPGRAARLAIVLWALSAAGKVIVSIAPEHRWPTWNAIGTLNVPVGAVAILATCAAIRETHPSVATTGVVLASMSLVAVSVAVLGDDSRSGVLSVGRGGLERLGDSPGVLWVFIVGVVALRSSFGPAVPRCGD